MTAGVLFGRYVVPASGSTGTRERPVPRAGAQPSVGAHPTTGASDAATPVVVPRPGESKATTPPAQAAGLLPGTPTRVNEFGIPVGYPHSEAGAISACGNYISAIQNPGNRSKSKIISVFQSIALPDTVDPLSKKILDADSSTAKQFGIPSINDPKFGFNLRVVGYRTLANKDDDATISVWSTSSIGVYGNDTSRPSPQEKWGTDICKVSWQGNDWKLADANDGPDAPAITSRESEAIQRFAYVGGPTT